MEKKYNATINPLPPQVQKVDGHDITIWGSVDVTPPQQPTQPTPQFDDMSLPELEALRKNLKRQRSISKQLYQKANDAYLDADMPIVDVLRGPEYVTKCLQIVELEAAPMHEAKQALQATEDQLTTIEKLIARKYSDRAKARLTQSESDYTKDRIIIDKVDTPQVSQNTTPESKGVFEENEKRRKQPPASERGESGYQGYEPFYTGYVTRNRNENQSRNEENAGKVPLGRLSYINNVFGYQVIPMADEEVRHFIDERAESLGKTKPVIKQDIERIIQRVQEHDLQGVKKMNEISILVEGRKKGLLRVSPNQWVPKEQFQHPDSNFLRVIFLAHELPDSLGQGRVLVDLMNHANFDKQFSLRRKR